MPETVMVAEGYSPLLFGYCVPKSMVTFWATG